MKRWAISTSLALSLLCPASLWAICGDAVTDAGEQCDDGNVNPGDGCDAGCQLECDLVATGLINGDYEFPGSTSGMKSQFVDEDVPGWTFGITDPLIEFHASGFQSVTSLSGQNHLELNAEETGIIYQEFDTVPGATIDWSISHRAQHRNRTETIEISFGVEVNLQSQGQFDAQGAVWITHTGSYVVPQGQYETRLEIKSIAPTGKKGNMLDDARISFRGFDAFADCSVLSPTPTYQSTGNGNLKIISNAMLSCPDSDVDCADGRALVDGATRIQNSQFDMGWVDTDADIQTFNSSSAQLSLAGTETVVWAGLYWMGGYTDFNRPFITPPPDPAARNTVSFKTPGGSYVDVVGSVSDIDGRFYRSYADVTSMVQTGGEYWVANLQASQGKWLFGGWTLVVVTQDNTEPKRTFSVYDPFVKVEDRFRMRFSGFAAVYASSAAIDFGTVIYDGDHGAGDIMLFNGEQLLTEEPDPSFPQEMRDIGNSTVREFGVNVTTRNPAHPNNFGFDSGLFDLRGLLDGATDIEFEIITNSDVMLTGIYAFQTDVL